MAAALERALNPAGPEAAASVPESPLLVLGPAGSGRTALLLRAALAGGGDGPRALFLAPSAPSRLPDGGGGDPRALQVRGGGAGASECGRGLPIGGVAGRGRGVALWVREAML